MFSLNNVIKALENAALIGSPAHYLMAPEGIRLERDLANSNYVDSAVLLLLFQHEGSVHITFIKRAEYEGVHSGQIAFPGGRVELYDIDYWNTAVRETVEEIAVNQSIKFICKLSDLYVPPSGYLIHPFVGYIEKTPVFTPDSFEVAEVFHVDLQWFFKSESKSEFQYKKQKTIIAPCFKVNNHIIWGATSMILNELLLILANSKIFNFK